MHFVFIWPRNQTFEHFVDCVDDFMKNTQQY